MKILLARHLAIIMKAALALCLLWMAAMLAIFWMSGAEETKQALASGKRFIIHIADGRVEGLAPAAPEQTAEATPAPDIPPPAAAEPEMVTDVQASANPIAEVSDDLLDKSAGTVLPKISEAGIKPWQYYIKTFRRQNEMPLIAIIITGLGHSKHTTEMALALDDRIGLAFSPYAAAITGWSSASRMTGHEMYVELPLQTAGYPDDDPGPYSILVTGGNDRNLKHLQWAMSRFQGYVGLVAPPREVVTRSADAFAPLREEIARRGVMLVRARDAVAPEGDKKKKQVPIVELGADVWIDEELSDMSIQARLATLEQMAQRDGMAIGIARAYPLSITQIKQWQETLGSHGIVLAPASFIAKLKFP
ncbi:MAG: divergent polysaccharide deacetylase family protein [Alphaproteobacteria bacterium]|nr:divergent polysaccharide deacetylase family protein [Alphaproteobacteria bacterium]